MELTELFGACGEAPQVRTHPSVFEPESAGPEGVVMALVMVGALRLSGVVAGPEAVDVRVTRCQADVPAVAEGGRGASAAFRFRSDAPAQRRPIKNGWTAPRSMRPMMPMGVSPAVTIIAR